MGDEPWAWALQEKIRCLFSIKLTCWICAHRRHSQQESGTCCKTSVCWQHGPGDSAYLFSARPPREAICDEDVIYGLTRGPGGVHNLWCIVFATLDCALSLWGRGGGTGHGACFSERAMVIGAITTCWPIILSIVAMLVTAKIAETLVAVGCWILLAHALSLRRCRLFACTLPSVSIHKADEPESHVMFPKASDFFWMRILPHCLLSPICCLLSVAHRIKNFTPPSPVFEGSGPRFLLKSCFPLFCCSASC